jgi:hypothetical protein
MRILCERIVIGDALLNHSKSNGFIRVYRIRPGKGMEMQIVFAIFVILHGLIHMWYVTLSQGWVEFQVEMGWNGRSWLLTDALGEKLSLNIASVLYVLSTLLFIITGVALLAKAPWARVALIVPRSFPQSPSWHSGMGNQTC